jgi:hypothetical protein
MSDVLAQRIKQLREDVVSNATIYPTPVDPYKGSVEESIAAMKELVEIATRQRGDVMDSFISVRDLVELGIIDPVTGVVSTSSSSDTGTVGPPGGPGADGQDGVGVPAGGTTGQVLQKATDIDYDTEWVDDEVDYTTRTDFVGDTLIYSGKAAVGSGDSDSAWQIKQITIAADGDTTTLYADSSNAFTNVWTDRASLTYG